MTKTIPIILSLLLCRLYAQPGSLDTDFGDMGINRIDFEDRVDRFRDVKLVNGDILAVGVSRAEDQWDYVLAKFDQQGAPLRILGEDELVRAKFGNHGFHEAVSIALDKQQNAYIAINSYDQDEIHIIKLDPEGALVTSFAEQGEFIFSDTLIDWICNRVYVHPDGALYVGSESGDLISILKVDNSGNIDSSFATYGLAVLDMLNSYQRILAMTGQEDGKLLVCGEAATEIGWRGYQMRVNPDGTIDSSFGETGYIEDEISAGSSRSNAISLQEDGRILFGGSLHNGTMNDAYFKRFLSNGQLDVSFGELGVVVLPTGRNNVMSSLYVLSDKSILAAGDRAIVRLMPDGAPDISFGNAGIVDVWPLSIYAMTLDDLEDMYAVGGEATGMFVAKYKSSQSTTHVIRPPTGFQVTVAPVPFTDHLTLDYIIPTSQEIRVELYDVRGTRVKTLWVEHRAQEGSHHESFQVSPSLPAGSYFIKFTVGGASELVGVTKL